MWIDGVVNNLVIQNTKMHGASGLIWWGLDQGSCSGNVCSNLFTFTGNEVTDTSTGIAFAQGSGSNRISDIEIYGNHVHDFQNWNDASSYDHHHEFIHMYTYGTAALPMNLYNNVFDGDAGSGTAWIYIEINSGASGGGPINIFNNLFAACASAIPSLGAGGMRMLEIEYGNVPTKIYNNTFWGTPNANCTISQAGQTTVNIMNGIYLNATNTQPDVRNNIVGGVLGNGFESGTLGASSSNNLLVCGGMSTPVNGTGGPVPSCGTNPNLNASYKIQNTSSSAYHTGANLTGNPNANINVDLASVGRPASGAWDIGAYQYAASAVAPAVATTAASGITSTTASSGGNVTSDGGASVTARGVCYATTANPTSPCTSDGTGTGVFTSSLSGLTSNTLYHIRAFATNSAGTSYGSDLTFTTLPPPAPIVSLDATSHDFGAQMVGIQSSGFVFNLQNTGNAVLAITSITPSGDFSSSSNCPISPSTLGIGSSCTITATFRPTLVGARSGSILISDNAADTPQAISLSGTGLPTQAGSVGTGISAGWVVVR